MVYRAKLIGRRGKMPQIVAVKTLKGEMLQVKKLLAYSAPALTTPLFNLSPLQ